MNERPIHTQTYDGADRRSENPDWHANKNYLLSIILLLISNMGASVWWASGISSDVEVLKSKPDLTERVIRIESTISLHNEYFDRFSDTLLAVGDAISRIDREQARRGAIINRVEEEHTTRYHNENK